MLLLLLFFFCKYPATTEIYTYGHTRSLHDALPICRPRRRRTRTRARGLCARCRDPAAGPGRRTGGASRVRGAAAVPPGGHDPRVVRAAGLTVHLRWLPLQRGSQETSTPLLPWLTARLPEWARGRSVARSTATRIPAVPRRYRRPRS